jgi:hypothetical protein
MGPREISAEAVARQKLASAIAALPAAQAQLEAAQQAHQRVQDIIDTGEHVERLARRAEGAVASATRAWSEAGAPENVPSVDPALVLRLTQARRDADAAAFQAEGAKAALPKLRAAVEDVQTAMSQVKADILAAGVAVMASLIEDDLQELELQAKKNAQRVARIHALRIIMHGKWGPMSRYHKFGNSPIGQSLEQRLRDTGFHIPSEQEVRRLSNAWADLGERLVSDPDAI